MMEEAIVPQTKLAQDDEMKFLRENEPQAGEVVEITERIYWLRMPLPGRINHVNNWLMEDDEGWTVIDCGLNNDETAQIWQSLFDGMLSAKPVMRIIVTHAHVDHVGFLGHLVKRTGAPVTMTISEYQTAALRNYESRERMADQSHQAALRGGCPPDVIEAMVSRRGDVRSGYSGVPTTYRRAMNGHEIRMAGRDWTMMTFGGHSPEMLCLYDMASQVLIAGDQVLTHITPSINVHPSEPWGDPLSEFYASFPRLEALAPGALVLPSHGLPFYGLHARVAQFRAHHDSRLQKVLSFVEGKTSAYHVAVRTFPSAMKAPVARQALAEVLAHLHYLEKAGAILSTSEGGVVYFERAAG
jgi:glyoxylase-like metal-dependent hydrolase (beta-lactamase superfamily II)